MKKFFVAICAFIAMLALIAASPLMNIRVITINGNEKFSNQEIIRMAEIGENTNIFALRTSAVKENLYKNTYIKYVNIVRDYRNLNLEINIVERQLRGYVRFRDNTYLFIDRFGMVLESRTAFTERHPVIEGLRFSEFNLGEYLVVENTNAFDTMLILSHLFEHFDIAQDIIRVNLSTDDEIHFYYGNINIQMGSLHNMELKIMTMMEILPTLEEYRHIGGFLHLQDPLRPRFSLLS
ncbi:MAG: FtsQ-type POTRA domain-containing protein [Defluviitaleaceae bacterium]|nr:FtsQ-type POTRA domain-containing protein [Defluviitaleaceae bacterium]